MNKFRAGLLSGYCFLAIFTQPKRMHISNWFFITMKMGWDNNDNGFFSSKQIEICSSFSFYPFIRFFHTFSLVEFSWLGHYSTCHKKYEIGIFMESVKQYCIIMLLFGAFLMLTHLFCWSQPNAKKKHSLMLLNLLLNSLKTVIFEFHGIYVSWFDGCDKNMLLFYPHAYENVNWKTKKAAKRMRRDTKKRITLCSCENRRWQVLRSDFITVGWMAHDVHVAEYLSVCPTDRRLHISRVI